MTYNNNKLEIEELKILDAHECKMANQHQAIEILNYEKKGWTLFADHSKMIDSEDDMQYRLSIDFCPFCGLNLKNKI